MLANCRGKDRTNYTITIRKTKASFLGQDICYFPEVRGQGCLKFYKAESLPSPRKINTIFIFLVQNLQLRFDEGVLHLRFHQLESVYQKEVGRFSYCDAY
jgi:hypothetical protein